MEIILLVPLATMGRCFEKGEVVQWTDRADALRLIKAGFAKEAQAAPKQR